MQTKHKSWQEAWTNIFVGYAINFIANMFVLPLFGFKSLTISKNIFIGAIYTAISVVRLYAIRRYFNKWEAE